MGLFSKPSRKVFTDRLKKVGYRDIYAPKKTGGGMIDNLVGFILPGGVRRKSQSEDKAYMQWRHAPLKKRADSLHQRPATRPAQRPTYRAGKGI